MSENVNIVYSEYGSSYPVIESAELELIEDMNLSIKCDIYNKQVTLAMCDTISDNTELEGTLTYDKLSVLIKLLSQVRSQIK